SSGQEHKTVVLKSVRVELFTCSSGDVGVRIERNGVSNFKWLHASGDGAGSWPLAVAYAQPPPGESEDPEQAAVVCMKRLRKTVVVRRLRMPTGQCQDQLINTFSGDVQTRPAPCSTDCQQR